VNQEGADDYDEGCGNVRPRGMGLVRGDPSDSPIVGTMLRRHGSLDRLPAEEASVFK